MALYVKQIDDYLIKDAEARSSIEETNDLIELLEISVSNQNEKINEQSNKINEHTTTLLNLTNSVNSHTQNITDINKEIEVLKTKEHLTITYDATNEKLSFTSEV